MQRSVRYLIHRLEESRLARQNRGALQGAASLSIATAPKKQALWQKLIAVLVAVTLWTGPLQMVWQDAANSAAQIAGGRQQKLAQQEAIDWHFFAVQLKDALHADQQKPDWSAVYTLLENRLPGLTALLLQKAGAEMPSLQFGTTAYAAPIADPAAPIRFQPQVTQSTGAGGGVPVVNITAPNAAGISLNQYSQFNVDAIGLILNNSLIGGGSALGGNVAANAALGGRTATQIINQVTTQGSPSAINGSIEVFGAPAQVIVANPNGISCTACGFINTPRVTMTTGTPQFLTAPGGVVSDFDHAGATAYDVQGGHIQIEGLAGSGGTVGTGIEGSTAAIDLISGSIGVNAAINGGQQINLISGQQMVSPALPGQGKAGSDYNVSANGSAPNFSGPDPTVQIDASAFGAMNAGQIKIIGTTNGLGVRTLGNVNATAGSLTIDANGDVTTANAYGSQGVSVRVDGTAAIGQLTSYGSASVAAGSDLAIGQLTVANDAQLTGNNVAVGETVIGGNLTANANGIMVTDQNGAIAGNAQLTAGTALINSGNWTVGNNLTVTAAGIQNNTSSSLIGLADTTLSASDLINNGTLYGNNLVLRIANTLNNNFGALQAKTLLDVRANALTGNVGGVMYAGDPSAVAGSAPTGDLSLVISGADGSFNNALGLIEAGNNLTLSAANQSFDPGAAVSGQINLNGALSLSVGSFTNSGAWSLPGATVSISSANGIINTGVMQTVGDFNLASANGVIANSGAIVAGQDLNTTGVISNAAGAIMHAERDVNINGSGVNAGTVEALRDVNLQGGSFDNSNGVMQANHNILANLTGTLTNVAGTIAGGQDVTLNAGSITNDRSAPVTLTSTTSQVDDLNLVLGTSLGDWIVTYWSNTTDWTGWATEQVSATIGTMVLSTRQGQTGIGGNSLSGTVNSLCFQEECDLPVTFSVPLPTVDAIQIQQTPGKAGQILAGNNATLTTASLSNTGGTISAGNNLVAAGLATLSNGSSASFITNGYGETVNQASLDAFMIAIQDRGVLGYAISNAYFNGVGASPVDQLNFANITAPTTVVQNVTSGTLGTLQAGGNATITGTGNLTNAGNLIAGNNIAITLPGNFVNQGTYNSQFTSTPGCLPGGWCTDPNAHVDTFAYQQTPNNVVAGGSLTVTAGTISNDYGSLSARGDVSLSANTLDNLAGTIQSTGGNVNIAAATIVNHVVSPVVTQTSFGSNNPAFASGCNAGGGYKGSECVAEMDNAASNAAIINGAQNVTINGDSLTNTGGLITAGVDANINISGAITNTDVALNTDWQGHWIEETCWTCDDVDHYTSGVVANGNQTAAIQAGAGLTLTSGGNLLNTGNLYGSNVDLTGSSLLNGIMDSSTPTALSTVAPQLVSLGPVGTASGGSGTPSTQAPLYAVSVPGSALLSDLGPNLLVDNLPPALRPDNPLFYYDGTAEDQQIQQAALTQTGTGTFINGVTWDPTNQLSIDDQQKAILYNNTIDFATQNNIQLGQPLTPQQISSIDKPMLWYTEQSVPDPSCSFTATLCPNINALMPQVLLPQNYTGTTAGGTISGNNVNLTFADSITNTGIIQATDLNVTTTSLTNEQRSVDIGKQAYQVEGGWMEYSGTQLQPGGFMSAVNLDVQAQNITAVNNAFQVMNADGTPDAAGTAALLSSLKQQLGGNFTQTSVQDDIQHNFIQDTSGPGALGAVIAIAIAIVLAVVTAGAGLAVVGFVTGTETIAAGSVAAIVAAGVQAAIVGTLSSLATQLVTTGSLDIGAALKSGAVSGIIGGVTAGVLGNAPGSSTASGSAAAGAGADSATTVASATSSVSNVSQASWQNFLNNPTQYLSNTLIRSGISAAVDSAAYGGSFGTAFLNGVVSDAAAIGANGIGGSTDPYSPENILGHALLGCAAAGLSGSDCSGGAIGGATSAIVAPLVRDEIYDGTQTVTQSVDSNGVVITTTSYDNPTYNAAIAALSILAGGSLGIAFGSDGSSAANAAANEVLNNAVSAKSVKACLEGAPCDSVMTIRVGKEELARLQAACQPPKLCSAQDMADRDALKKAFDDTEAIQPFTGIERTAVEIAAGGAILRGLGYASGLLLDEFGALGSTATDYSAIGSTGKIGELYLKTLGGDSQVYFSTSTGARYVDQLVDGVANEAKVGYVSLTTDVQAQIAKDVELMQTGQVSGVTWNFFTSPVTGIGGPSAPLLDALQKAGITVLRH